MPRAPSSSSAVPRRAGSFWPLATITSTPADSSACMFVRVAAREQTMISGAFSIEATSFESSGRLASESKITRVGCFGTASTRAVSSGSSAVAVWIPTTTASTSARQRCARARLDSFEIHFESPAAVATLPSSVVATLKTTCGRPVSAVLAERLVEQPGLRRHGAVHDVDLDPLVAQDPEPASVRLRRRVVARDHDARDLRLQDRFRARRRPALVGARLDRHVHRRPFRVLLACRERAALRMGQSGLLVESLADRAPVFDDHGAHKGVRTRPSTRLLGQLEGPQKVLLVALDHKVDSRVNLPPATLPPSW